MPHDEYLPPPWLPGTPAPMEWRRRVLPLPDKVLQRLAWSSQGAMLAGTWDDGVVIYDLTTADAVPHLVHQRRQFWGDVAWSPDGQLLATSAGEAVVLWEVRSMSARRTLAVPESAPFALAFHPAGHQLAVGSGEVGSDWHGQGHLHLFDPHTGAVLAESQEQHWILRACYSPDGCLLAYGGAGQNRDVWLWDTRYHYKKGLFAVPAWWQDPDLVAIGFADTGHTVQMMDGYGDAFACSLRTAKIQRLLRMAEDDPSRAEMAGILGACFSPDGCYLVHGPSQDNEPDATRDAVRVWQLTGGLSLTLLHGHTHPVTAVAMSHAGDSLAVADAQGIHIWDVTALVGVGE